MSEEVVDMTCGVERCKLRSLRITRLCRSEGDYATVDAIISLIALAPVGKSAL